MMIIASSLLIISFDMVIFLNFAFAVGLYNCYQLLSMFWGMVIEGVIVWNWGWVVVSLWGIICC